MKLTWQDLFDYLESDLGCHFREGEKGVEWWCDNTLRFTERFCKDNNLDFNIIKGKCESTGGYCDCEVLFNTKDKISSKEELK